MIPPLVLDVKPGHVVLDLCAAPGSKASQILEMLHQGEEGRMLKALQLHSKEDGREAPAYRGMEEVDMTVDAGDDGRATGLLIANDMDYKRSHLLIHQLKRLSSPNMMVTNHDATLFPSIKLPSDDPKRPNYLKFDRILADVPCSGDGTMRKNVNLWNDWNPGNALGLHQTQVRILTRALQMLKPGGRVVYSTCSMNPVENESVIAAAMDRCGHENVEVLDCEHELPALKRKPGLKTWKIMDKTGRIWDDWKEVEEWMKESQDGEPPGRLVKTMFPVEGDVTPLERCMRVYAHQQDTGGFFITALHKKKEFKAKPENWDPANKTGKTANSAAATEASTPKPENGATEPEAAPEVQTTEIKPEESENKPENGATQPEAAPKVEENGTSNAPNPMKRMMEDPPKEETPAPQQEKANLLKRSLEDADDETAPVKKQDTGENKNGLKAELVDGYSVRKAKEPFEEPFKYLSADHPVITNIQEFYKISKRFPTDRYMVRNSMGEPAKAIYYTSALARDIFTSNEGRNVKFVHGGVKMFMKQESPSAEVCRWRIQSEGIPILQGYVGPERTVTLHNKETLRRLLIEMFPKITEGEWQKLDEIGERIRDIGMGCCVLKVEPDGTDPDFSERMVLPLWKSFQSLNLMLPKEDRAAMLLRIFDDTTPLVNVMLNKDREAQSQADKAKARGEVPAKVEEPEIKDEAMADAQVADAEVAKEPVVKEEEKVEA